MKPLVPFIEIHKNNNAPALQEEGQTLSYAQLYEAVQQRAAELRELCNCERALVILRLTNSIDGVLNHLAVQSLNWVALLLHPDTSDAQLASYQSRYRPNIIVNQTQWLAVTDQQHELHEQVRLLLSTSGSTGTAKCVALSACNLEANCSAILSYLPITQRDITVLTLPLSYSYGLSVLHTHLAAGARLVFTSASVFNKAFWSLVKTLPVTSLAGVPSFYEMLLKLRFTRMDLPSLRYFTQAGGRLDVSQVSQLSDYAATHDKRFFVMYGQTEATARMAYVEPDVLARKPHCIGRAIPGGEFCLKDENGNTVTTTNTTGELCYRGANVMLGYAETVADLCVFNPFEWLHTGDLAMVDSDGDYTITGRLKRMLKVFGERVNLDALEQQFATAGLDVRCCGEDNGLVIACKKAELAAVEAFQKDHVGLPRAGVALVQTEQWPLLVNGKIDYSALTELPREAGT
ncbi:MAG: hypothetical protein CBB67_013895 [Alteromonadaceae bacterium TMED7]|nr:hypothetical protein [Alteromonadaceae bacterium]RPH16983.1 MAG: hypothetical protein CBB67_013895 [Alteromonadaceae bacterium TMED7]|tara:strand:+ start:54465 stop:55847 length:1383 start_codon:yes stop_codon:yes gene_type:complete